MRLLFLASTFAVLAAACSSTSSATPDGGSTVHDHNGCTLPADQICCNGDVGGDYNCEGTTVVCDQGTHLTPSSQCVTPPARDAGQDAEACAPPTGYACCDGDVGGPWTCGPTGLTVCPQGTSLQLQSACKSAPADGGPDATDADVDTDASDAAPE